MMNILNKFKISYYTYLFMFLCFICGYIKNIIIIFSICIIHEFGHIFFIKLFKYNIEYIEILPFGGFTHISKQINSNINKDILIALGGIFFQLIFLIILINFKNNLNIITYNLIWQYNLLIILFNIIPIIPLDGSKITGLLLEKFLPYIKSYYLNFFISFLFLIFFLLVNIIYNLNNYFIIMFLIYNGIVYLINFKYLKNRFYLERVMYDLEFNKIDNNTKNIKDLRKNVYHYFKKNNYYINEKKMIKKMIYKD